jgi:hypothetical protein
MTSLAGVLNILSHIEGVTAGSKVSIRNLSHMAGSTSDTCMSSRTFSRSFASQTLPSAKTFPSRMIKGLSPPRISAIQASQKKPPEPGWLIRVVRNIILY